MDDQNDKKAPEKKSVNEEKRKNDELSSGELNHISGGVLITNCPVCGAIMPCQKHPS